MIRTILISSHIQIQGLFVKALENGEIIVAVGKEQFRGRPLSPVGVAAPELVAS